MFKFFTVWSAALFLSVAAANAGNVDDGRAAYQAGDYETAWQRLAPAAEDGDIRAKRYLGYMLLESVAPDTSVNRFYNGVALLEEAARAGDYAALLRLEDLRRRALAHSPSLQDIVDIEIERAGKGDPVTAWRLAKRYQSGDGVAPSTEEMLRWLTVVASVDSDHFPKTGEAAFRLCEHYATEDNGAAHLGQARHWCAEAARKGVPAAAFVLGRLAQLAVE